MESDWSIVVTISRVKAVPVEQKGHAAGLPHGIGEAVTEIELGGMPPSLAIPREGIERRLRFSPDDHNGPDPAMARNSCTSAYASATLACRLRQMPPSNTAIGEVIGERAASRASVRASASGSRVRTVAVGAQVVVSGRYGVSMLWVQ
jgi:hypothetical protein